MKTVAAKAAKDRFGTLIDVAQQEPVTIKKHGREVAVVLSMAEYLRLSALEDEAWINKAKRAEKAGMMSKKDSHAFLDELLHASD